MAVSVALSLLATITEVLSIVDAPGGVQSVQHSAFNKTATLNASSTPPVSKTASFAKTLSSGTGTIDLTALSGTNGATVDFTGLKVQLYLFWNPDTNANAITVTFGASTAYLLRGAAWKFILQPGDYEIGLCINTAPTVSSSLKNIDLAGTGAQVLNVALVAG